MISPTRWEFAQAAEKAYQEGKAQKAHANFDRIVGLAARKSNYVVKLLKRLGFEISQDMAAVEIGSGAHGMIWKFPCENRTAVDPLADFYFDEFSELQDNGTIVLPAKGEDIPLPDNYADIVLSENVLDHTHNPQLVLHEATRILKPAGIFYFAVDVNSLQWICMSKIYNFIFHIGLHLNTRAFPAHPHHFSKRKVLKMFSKAGLTVKWQRVRSTPKNAQTWQQKLLKLLGDEEIFEIVAIANKGL